MTHNHFLNGNFPVTESQYARYGHEVVNKLGQLSADFSYGPPWQQKNNSLACKGK